MCSVVFVVPIFTTFQEFIVLKCCVLKVLFFFVLSDPLCFVLFLCFCGSDVSMLSWGREEGRGEEGENRGERGPQVSDHDNVG